MPLLFLIIFIFYSFTLSIYATDIYPEKYTFLPRSFDHHKELGFEILHKDNIKGAGTIAVIEQGAFGDHPALTKVNWINSSNVDTETLSNLNTNNKCIHSPSGTLHKIQVTGIISAQPLEDPMDNIPGIDFNIGLAHEATVDCYLTPYVYDDPSQLNDDSSEQYAVFMNTLNDMWISTFDKIRASSARIICIANAFPFNNQFKKDVLSQKENPDSTYIRGDLLLAIQTCLSDQTNPRLLVISASNTGRVIGEYSGTWDSFAGFKYIEQLATDLIISQHLIIVGNCSIGIMGTSYDVSHPSFFKTSAQYFTLLQQYLIIDNPTVSFVEYIKDKPELQAYRRDDIEILALNLLDSIIHAPQVHDNWKKIYFQQYYNLCLREVEQQYPKQLSLELVESRIEEYKHQYSNFHTHYLDENEIIAIHANSGKAGIAQNVFMTAIGTSILTPVFPTEQPTPYPGGSLKSYARTLGSSCDTPMVASALNLLLQANSKLDVFQIRSILFETASKSTRNPEIHGQGAMNLLKAYQRVKELHEE